MNHWAKSEEIRTRTEVDRKVTDDERVVVVVGAVVVIVVDAVVVVGIVILKLHLKYMTLTFRNQILKLTGLRHSSTKFLF